MQLITRWFHVLRERPARLHHSRTPRAVHIRRLPRKWPTNVSSSRAFKDMLSTSLIAHLIPSFIVCHRLWAHHYLLVSWLLGNRSSTREAKPPHLAAALVGLRRAQPLNWDVAIRNICSTHWAIPHQHKLMKLLCKVAAAQTVCITLSLEFVSS